MNFFENMETKRTKTILSISKLALLVLAFLLLLISFSVTETKELYATSGGQRYSVNKEYDYFTTNFFGRMTYLGTIGFDPVLEIIFLIVLAINILVAIAAFVPKCEALNKIYFSALPLAAAVLCIVLMIDGDCSYLKGIEGPVYYEGLKVYLKKDVTFDINLAPSLGGCILAFVISLVPGVFEFLKRKGEKEQNNGAALSDIQRTDDNQTPSPSAFIGSVPDKLKKFKELLDMDIITQEEFDAKKKELLGL